MVKLLCLWCSHEASLSSNGQLVLVIILYITIKYIDNPVMISNDSQWQIIIFSNYMIVIYLNIYGKRCEIRGRTYMYVYKHTFMS